MVVIAISGVLMALLLPALSSAKEKSRRSVCGQNIRQDLMALTMYGDGDDQGRLPPSTDNRGAYHSIRLSDFTFTNLVANLSGESNSLYCPNLVHATGKMGGYDPDSGYIIGYSYLAAAALPVIPKGPSPSWTGPLKADETGEVLADANYWNTTPSELMTIAPHTAAGGTVATPMVSSTGRANTSPAASASNKTSPASMFSSAGSSSASPFPGFPTPGATSTAMGAAGGNIGWLNGSVIWQPIHLMKQYPASIELDGPSGAFGNW